MTFEVIAEIGVNHNGSLSLAKDLVSAAADAGADYAKVQVFDAGLVAHESAALASYQHKNGVRAHSQFEMLKALELSQDEVQELSNYAQNAGIKLLCTPFDLESLRFVVEDLGHEKVKFASGDLTFVRLLWQAATSEIHMFVSTGMASFLEIESAMQVIRFGRAQSAKKIDPSIFPTKANLATHRAIWTDFEADTTLFHCTSDYPASLDQLNMLALQTMKPLATSLGYSDHSEGELAAIVGMSLGATVFEKHITLDRAMDGPDHRASATPQELRRYIEVLGKVSLAMGNGKKVVQRSELNTIKASRRGIYASRDISAGQVLLNSDMVELRPSNDSGSEAVFSFIGSKAKKDFSKGEPIE